VLLRCVSAHSLCFTGKKGSDLLGTGFRETYLSSAVSRAV
jgi:hypothetical protein